MHQSIESLAPQQTGRAGELIHFSRGFNAVLTAQSTKGNLRRGLSTILFMYLKQVLTSIWFNSDAGWGVLFIVLDIEAYIANSSKQVIHFYLVILSIRLVH